MLNSVERNTIQQVYAEPLIPAVSILVHGRVIVINFSSTKPAIDSIALFSEIPGIAFEYPVFRGWGVRRVEKKGDDECVIWLDWPSTLSYGVAPRITVSVFRYQSTVPASRTLSKTASNGFGVDCERVSFPSDYVAGYESKGYWDALWFRKTGSDESVIVRIPVGSEHGFSRELFADSITATFRFS